MNNETRRVLFIKEDLLRDRQRIAELRAQLEAQADDVTYEIIPFSRIGIAHTTKCEFVEVDAVSIVC